MNSPAGLVVCGGSSSRMGADKSLLVYHGLPQRYYLFELLELICEKTFISCNTEQAAGIPFPYDIIIDDAAYKNIGPMAALLSAFKQFPGNSFMMIGCDYPFINKEDIERLINSRKENTLATCYYNDAAQTEEPLLAIYEKGIYPLLKERFERSQFSLRRLLKEVNATRIAPSSLKKTESIDTPEAYQKTINLLLHE